MYKLQMPMRIERNWEKEHLEGREKCRRHEKGASIYFLPIHFFFNEENIINL